MIHPTPYKRKTYKLIKVTLSIKFMTLNRKQNITTSVISSYKNLLYVKKKCISSKIYILLPIFLK